jgi:hypothetical protein
MSFPIGALRYLIESHRRFGLGGRCLTLGSNPHFCEAATLRRFLPTAAGDGLMSDRQALGEIGFQDVIVLDCRPSPGVDIVADLNQLDPALAARGPFDFVLDWGAASRLFRLANYFRNLLQATRPGSTVWHIAPSDNLFGRGTCMISPTLFADFYATNRWDILEMHAVHVRSWHDDNWFTTPYVAGTLDWMCFGSAPAGAHLVSALVRRRHDSTADQIPQQSWFLRWTAFRDHMGAAQGVPPPA